MLNLILKNYQRKTQCSSTNDREVGIDCMHSYSLIVVRYFFTFTINVKHIDMHIDINSVHGRRYQPLVGKKARNLIDKLHC